METATTQNTTTSGNNTSVATRQETPEEVAVIQSKRSAWANMGEIMYKREMQLQAQAQAITMNVKPPTKIEEVPSAEAVLTNMKKTGAAIEISRKEVTGRLGDFVNRLMQPEKLVANTAEALGKAIISVKSAHEATQRNVQALDAERKAIREKAASELISLDASVKQLINDLIDKAYVFALEGHIGRDIPPTPIDKINEYLQQVDANGKIKITEQYFSADKLPTCPRVFKITQEEANAIWAETFTSTVDTYMPNYVSAYSTTLKQKFSDYEVAFANIQDALARNAADKAEADKKIAQETINNQVAASMESATQTVEAVPTVDTKALKKSYTIDMPETIESVLIIMAAFAANKDKCLAELKVNKWFAFTPAQAGIALSKIKNKDNAFAPAGLKFKEVEKL